MANSKYLMLVMYASLLVLLTSMFRAGADEERKVYIVYMGSLPKNQQYKPSSHHVSLVQKITGQSFSEKLIVRSYNRSFNGFAAKLTRDEAEELSSVEGVVSVFSDRKYQLLTTRSWNFLGFSETVSRRPQSERDIIIGIIDTGIWPELASFSDEGFGPPPKKWKGVCKGGTNFTCNNKMIGARYYGTLKSARDTEGHGSHVASIAAGVAVKNTSFFGFAQGTARGGAPSARIVAYKVCDSSLGCLTANILGAFDDAIADGVDILSISVGLNEVKPFDQDGIAIGAFHAMANGILTSNSAGNGGSNFGVTFSVAPWLISVAASTTDRHFITKGVLGNGKTIVGNSINSFDLNGTKYPLVNVVFAEEGDSFKGKIVGGAFDLDHATTAYARGAVGVFWLDERLPDISGVVPIPAVASPDETDFNLIVSYINSIKNPVATILRSEEIKDSFAPVVASFSSRGPNSFLQEIMKPDVTAPGVEILAGYSPIAPASDTFGTDKRHVLYTIVSGTSMSCPHVSGIAAYVKSFHPDWSPSAIKSAIMTTATPLNPTANPEGEFAYGSGQVNPVKAAQPGLVYEALQEDYIKLLCRAGYDEKRLRAITGSNSSCPTGSVKGPVLDFNYPSLTAKVNQDTPFTLTFQRTVTNVGVANSTYQAKVSPSRKFDVKVEPRVLSFKALKEKKAFNITVSGKGLKSNVFESVALVWSDGIHNVRTPVVVHTISR